MSTKINSLNKYCLSLFVIGIALLFSVCRPATRVREQGQPIAVLATTGIVADMVKAIGGKNVTCETLMGPGVDPHLYKVSQNDLLKIARAQIIFYNGLHLEGKMTETLHKIENKRTTVALGESLPKELLHATADFGGSYDPHIWFDVALWLKTAKVVEETLSKNAPEFAEQFKQNRLAYEQQLMALHQEVLQSIGTIEKERRILITAHDAFGYFGKAYDMEVRGLQGISTLTDYGLSDVNSLVNYIVSKKIKAIFVESSVSGRAINAVLVGCKSKGWPVKIGGTLYSDALGAADKPEGTYIGMVKYNTQVIVSALK
jgi:manganese/zinc/iron transport system substrate-binding protein